MRKLIILFVTLATITSCDLKRENFNSSKKHFTNEVLLGYTPVKDQGHSSLCWAYAMLATIETEHIQMGDSVNLSVDYIARYQLGEQARFHFLSKGYDRRRCEERHRCCCASSTNTASCPTTRTTHTTSTTSR